MQSLSFWESEMQFFYLSKEFYEKYADCPEILQKQDRPYVVLVIDVGKKKFAVPIRTHINKKNLDSVITKPGENSGLDFIKAVCIEKESYIEKTRYPEISQMEFNVLKFKEREITRAFTRFVTEYIKDAKRHKKNPAIPQNPRFQFCTLKYFDAFLGIV